MVPETDDISTEPVQSDCVLVGDSHGTIVWASPTVESILGHARSEILDETVTSVLGSEFDNPPLPGDPSITQDLRLTTTDGDSREVLVSATSVAVPETITLYQCWLAGHEQLGLKTVLSRVSDGIISVDTDWRYTYVNEYAETLLGYSREELLGEVMWEVFPTAQGTQIQNAFEEAMETQEPTTLEWFGSSVSTWFEVRAYPSSTGMSVYFRDITERKERELALQRERDLNEQLLRGSPVGICVLTPDGQFQRVNERAEEILGVDREEMLNESFREPTWEVRDPDGNELEDDEYPFVIALKTGEPTFGHLQTLKRADGTRIWVSVSASPLLDDGTVDRVVVTFEDITERKVAEQELKESEALFRAVFEGTLDALVLADDDGTYVEVNEAACDLYGREESDLVGRNVAEFAPPEYDVAAAWETFLEAGTLRGEFPLVRPDGEIRTTDFVATANVRPGLHLSALRDITERKEDQRRLEAQRDELQRLNWLNELIRDVNHVVVTATDRAVIEDTVCTALADSENYPVAATFQVSVDGEVRVEHYAGLSESRVETLQAIGDDPLEAAIRETEATNTATILTDLQTDTRHPKAFREAAIAYDIDVIGTIPIEYDGVVYGVLLIAASSRDALGEREQSVFVELGQLLGTAINAIQTRKLLSANTFTELELAVPAACSSLVRLNERVGGVWTLDGVVPIEQRRYLLYVDVGAADPAEIDDASTSVDDIESLRIIETGPSRTLEIRVSETTLIGSIFDAGGWIRNATFEDGVGRLFVDIPLDSDVRSFLDRLRTSETDVELLAKREVERSAPGMWADVDPETDLTERQQTVIEAAFRSGYFDWPRRQTTGEELADSLDIASSTLHQHLRVATAKVIAQFFAAEPLSGE